MALAELKVYDEFLYTATTEIIAQNIAAFNEASQGTIVLRPSAHLGDYSDTVFYAKIDALVRRRNVYAEGAISSRRFEHLVDTSVKVAAGTPQIEMQPSQWTWIQRDPEEAAAVLAQQLAGDMMADMLNTALGACVAALSNQPKVYLDQTAATDAKDRVTTLQNLVRASGRFGDRQSAIRVWVMHSGPLTDLYLQAVNNLDRLFSFGTINIYSDGFNRLFVVTDSDSLTYGATPGEVDGYYTLGLGSNAIYVGQNNDWDTASEEKTGGENIKRFWQAEWTYNLGIQGFAWDKATGGHSPNDAAIMAAANWDRTATSHKDLAGVLLKTLAA